MDLGGTIPPSPWLERLSESLPAAHAGIDPEAVHRVRVACGRLDVWLRLGGWRILRDDATWLRGRAAGFRDLDIALAQEPPEAVRAWMTRRRSGARRTLRDAIDSPRPAAFLRALRLLPVLDRETARRAIGKLERRVAEAGRAMEKAPLDVERLHDFRILLRRLRYATEWLGDASEALVRAQDAFGELNDVATTLAIAKEWTGTPQPRAWRRRLEARLAELRTRALGVWIENRPAVEGLR